MIEGKEPTSTYGFLLPCGKLFPSKTIIRVLKNRYTGDTGVACRLHYDKESGRMTELENPFVEEEENNIPF